MPAAPWRVGERRKSSYSDAGNGCVEAELTEAGVDVRDTKQLGTGRVIHFGFDDWPRLVAGEPPEAVQVSNADAAWQVHGGGHTLHFTDHEWQAFRLGAGAGEFDPHRVSVQTAVPGVVYDSG